MYPKTIYRAWLLLLLLAACGKDEPMPPTPPTPAPTTLNEGFNLPAEGIQADKPLTLTLKIPTDSPLFGASSLYLHSGLGAQWQGAPVWGTNDAKYRLTPVAGQMGVWTITLGPTVAAYYGQSASSEAQWLNLLVRTADGSRQTADYAFPMANASSSFTLPAPTLQPLPLTGENVEGIHLQGGGTATLVLYDRDKTGKRKSHAYVVSDLSGWRLDDRFAMRYDESRGCWWLTLTGLPTGQTAFQYYLYDEKDGGVFLCDPYSEQVREKDVDADFPAQASGRYVSVIDTQGTEQPMTSTFRIAHPESLVIYELLLRDFTAEGTLAAAQAKLPYLKALGVNAIELMPVQEFAGADSWGYDTSFYFALDGSYGRKQAYRNFVTACHEQGLAVILDVVYNHTNAQNPFARQYWDKVRNRPSATNPWLNAETPHKKYVFSPCDFNHESAQTRAFVKRNLAHLLRTYGFDGFRFDFTKGFTQKPTTEDADLSAYDAGRVAVLREYRDAVKAVRSDAVVIMEHFSEPEEAALSQEGIRFWRNLNDAYCQLAMGWSERSDLGRIYDPGLGFVGFMESHDEERMAYKQSQWGNGLLKTSLPARTRQLAAGAAFFLTVPGPKMIWQFGELGYDFSINSDRSGGNVNEGNRTARKPIRWDYYEQADRRELYSRYAALLALRTAHPELFGLNVFRQWRVGTSDWNQGRYIKLEHGAKKLLVLGNFTADEIRVEAPFGSTGPWREVGVGTYTVTQATEQLTVPAHGYRLFVNFD